MTRRKIEYWVIYLRVAATDHRANTGMAHWPRRGHRDGDQEASHGPRYQRLAGDRLAAGGFAGRAGLGLA